MMKKTNLFGLIFLLTLLTLLMPLRLWGVGYTPTDAGFVLNFEPGDQFLLSVWIDLNANGKEDAGEEFFVCDYPSYSGKSGGRFTYEAKDYLKLVPQAAGATTPSAASIWTVEDKLTHSTKVNGESANFKLDGICYTMWGNSNKTLYAAESPTKSSTFKIFGWLTDNAKHGDLCDVALVVPSDNTRTKSMDPNNTLGRASATGKFNGAMGTGFAGMVYREVYWFAIPRNNGPISYTNAALMTFNTTSSDKKWSPGTIKPGFAAYAYADTKHDPTTRTVFRIYILNEKAFSSCDSYFFGWDVQDYTRYRDNANNSSVSYTKYRKIYTLDHFECMHLLEEGRPYYQTQGMKIPSSDSTYYYVGYNNTYLANAALVTSSGSPTSFTSAFKPIDSLRIRPLRNEETVFRPSKDAYGYMAVDTTSTKPNLGVTFEPAGYFFHTNSGRNVEMRRVDDYTWITNEMWTITGAYMSLQGEVLLYTGPTFSEDDPGSKIEGWSKMQAATSIPVYNHPELKDASEQSGWARIHINSPEKNGGIEFVLARTDRHIHYDYQGLIGTAIPDQYPMEGKTKVKIEDARLKAGFTFLGWATSEGGSVEYWTRDSINSPRLTGAHFVGDSIDLPEGTTTLYAVGTFNDTYRVAFSFIHPTDGKRYWLTHPNREAPRFARARTFTEWTDVYQGMSDAENSEPNYLSTYKMIGDPTCTLCASDEYVLDPQHETVHGVVDSLTFYENWAPADDEFIGLYYEVPNTVLANNTWAGAFKSTKGWPAYNRTAVDNTKIYSERYFTGMKEKAYAVHDRRIAPDDPTSDTIPAYLYYDPTKNQFDGVNANDATEFQITGIAVADAHYVILPDTTDVTLPWKDSVIFDYHNEAQYEQVWSKLIGKQLMACLRVGPDTVYFHPNRDKTLNTANELRLSNDYRLTHAFEFIHDSRPTTAISVGDSVTMEETENAFCCNLYSGTKSPINITDGTKAIDIVDTLRVWLRPSGTSKIVDYYGRWKKGAAGLHILANGYRYRDILVKTKTYHEGSEETRLILKPEHDSYNFSALGGKSQTLNFVLLKETSKALLDAAGSEISREVLSTDTVKSDWNLTSATATLKAGTTIFTEPAKSGTAITLSTQAQNAAGAKNDTLTVTIGSITIGGDTYTSVTAKVPLTQSSLQGDELVWSVVKGDKRYFIMAKSDGLVFREYNLRDNTLYKQNTTTALVKGSYDASNSDSKYITPWTFAYPDQASHPDQLTLFAESPISKYLAFSGNDGTVGDDAGKATLTYIMDHSNANSNANYEEVVKLKFGSDKWLKFTGDKLELTTESAQASTFYWGYLQQEYEMLNNGAYPSVDELVFGHNNTSPKAVTTAYKAYREYSMLLDNTLTYLCREEKSDSTTLVSDPWNTTYAVSLIRDSRFGVGKDSTKLSISKKAGFTTTITPAGESPMGTMYGGKYVDIVDTLQVALGTSREDYRFTNWEGVSSIEDAGLKIPLVRKTYHNAPYDSIFCTMEKSEYNFSFPSTLRAGVPTDSLKTFHFETVRLQGTNVLDVDNNLISSSLTTRDTVSGTMDLSSTAFAEIRLVDEFGQIPDWCEIASKGAKTITVRCKSNGVRSPRSAYLYFAYIVTVDTKYRYVNFKFTISQASQFQYTTNQTLIHMPGASGDPIGADGRQQAHENRRIMYYYNPKPYGVSDQDEELPVRERGFYGWWRWYREGKDQNKVDVGDTDIPDSVWVTEPRNQGKYTYPFRVIGDSVWKDESDHSKGKKLVTMGRYTVFRYPSKGYGSKLDPPAKSPTVKAPWNKDTVTYVVDISNYYDNLPLSMSQVNQIDTAVLDTLKDILEPTLSLREVYELHPWTEMAEKMESYKDTIAKMGSNLKYLEDHEVMAPIGNRLLLRTEQRYNYKNLEAKGHTESLLGYYMRDDHWSDGGWDADRKDTMIWCGGWDADCEWYTYKDGVYTKCNHPITVDDDFLNVPAKRGITAGQEADTVIYCLRSQSKSTTGTGEGEKTADGLYMFNICRYKIIYHDPRKYGPYEEKGKGSSAKALITNDEIEQNYEVLERLNFDYVKPGKDYHIYPHPLPWADASYGYSYPVTSEIPNNRYHDEKDFPGPGEYAIINKIPYSTYWRKLEQHGGAENGYMIYCDGMSSSGQVAALSLSTHLCEGQKMYFSGYVGNVSNQTGKSNPNFTFSVQGSNDGNTWNDITSYMTGDIQPSDKWYQIFFPINQEGSYDQFRIRIYNVASDFDGNDFIIDDMCVFATKPPLIAYQADTKCVTEATNDSLINVVLRVDYQGFVDQSYNSANVFYTVQQSKAGNDTTFVPMVDGYFNESTIAGKPKVGETPATPDTIFGYIPMPSQTYVPLDDDSIFTNLQQLATRFETDLEAWKEWKDGGEEGVEPAVFRKGYLYENLDGVARPVLYVIHQAKMSADYNYTIRLAIDNYRGLLSSKCAVTSNLNVTNRMVVELNGEEVEEEVTDMCANSTYDLALRIKGTLLNIDSVAPIDVKGSCVNDWLLYGDTAEASSLARYGYKYSDIKKVIMEVFRNNDKDNRNQFVSSLAAVNKNDIIAYAKDVTLSDGVVAYDLLDSLVTKGFLTLYQPSLTTSVAKGDSVQYMIFPILGTGTNDMNNQGMDVCPTPMLVKLKPQFGGKVPMIVGGIQRDSTEMSQPVDVLVGTKTANDLISLRIDSIMPTVAIHSISLLSTDDPDFYEGVHLLNLEPDKIYSFGSDISSYYKKGDDILLHPAPSNNYQMHQGYNYTFGIVMQGLTGSLTSTEEGSGGCPIGTIPFTVSVVPDYLRWDPQSKENNKWNDPNNWLGVTDQNEPLPGNPRFAPISSTDVIIPNSLESGMPYPELPEHFSHTDSIREVNFVYNTCDDIRFLPGAAIGQQQRLTCDATVIDMIIPKEKWALRSAPVTGMLSGDLYMSEADLSGETRPWYVGSFDANGRSWKTGNATFWLSLYNNTTVTINAKTANDTITSASADWSKVTNGLTLSLQPAQGWAAYVRTREGLDKADVRLPKSDDIYYYYGTYGEKLYDLHEDNLRELRASNASPNAAGKLAFYPGAEADFQEYRLTNVVADTKFVFGNPTLGYIDIWGFIADNSLTEEISYLNESGVYTTVTKETGTNQAAGSPDTITNQWRYLPPMHAIVITSSSAANTLDVTLNTNRIVTKPSQVVTPFAAPRHLATSAHSKGIMTVTAINSVSNRCVSRLLIGQGYNDAIVSGEDAVLTTLNINKFHMTNTPTTPFNIYAMEGGYGLSIDLRDSIVNVPVSFYLSDLPFEPTTYLWFTGVNTIDGPLVLYDALMDTERLIIDGICLDIETPEANHEKRYYIRRPGYKPGESTEPVTTGVVLPETNEQAVKIIRNGQVLIIRNGHVYTMFGQQIR